MSERNSQSDNGLAYKALLLFLRRLCSSALFSIIYLLMKEKDAQDVENDEYFEKVEPTPLHGGIAIMKFLNNYEVIFRN